MNSSFITYLSGISSRDFSFLSLEGEDFFYYQLDGEFFYGKYDSGSYKNISFKIGETVFHLSYFKNDIFDLCVEGTYYYKVYFDWEVFHLSLTVADKYSSKETFYFYYDLEKEKITNVFSFSTRKRNFIEKELNTFLFFKA